MTLYTVLRLRTCTHKRRSGPRPPRKTCPQCVTRHLVVATTTYHCHGVLIAVARLVCNKNVIARLDVTTSDS